MRVLVIGKGGREHALVRALRLSPSVTEVHALPGNAGMAQNAFIHSSVDVKSFEAVSELCEQLKVDLAIVGPEDPLVAGLSDHLREQGLLVFGPSKEAAQLEGSKVDSKEFMNRHGIPTSPYKVVQSLEDVQCFIPEFEPPYVLKVDGLAAGKGVFVCDSAEELNKAARRVFEDKGFGEAGLRALLEQYQSGWELSVLILTNGDSYQVLPLTQDHKRLEKGGKGPNTGGMGVVGPLKLSEETLSSIDEQVLRPTVAGLQKDGLDYRGVLYVGIMMTDSGPQVLEYNVRFGDPEAQVIFPLVDCDWGQTLKLVAQGQVPAADSKPLAAACVVLAAPGYPDAVNKGGLIRGQVAYETPSSYFLHAGTDKDRDGQWVVDGGRVLNAVGIGSDLKEALKHAYDQSSQVCWNGLQLREDIGANV